MKAKKIMYWSMEDSHYLNPVYKEITEEQLRAEVEKWTDECVCIALVKIEDNTYYYEYRTYEC